MATEVKLPRLGQGMESGTIVKWLKSEGEAVEKGEPLYELDTDKVTQEVEADASGVLLKIAVSEGEVEVGKTIAVIGEQGEQVELPSGDGDGAAPKAKRPAREHEASEPAVSGVQDSGQVEVRQLTKVRKTIARRLTQAWEAPVFQLVVSADMTQALALVERLRARHPADDDDDAHVRPPRHRRCCRRRLPAHAQRLRRAAGLSAVTVWYRVRNLDAARSFYRDQLGFEEMYVDWQVRWARLQHGVMEIALAEGEPEDGGVAHVDVEDVKAEAERLRADGVNVGTVLELHGHVRLLDVYDPDGNRVQLAQDLVD